MAVIYWFSLKQIKGVYLLKQIQEMTLAIQRI